MQGGGAPSLSVKRAHGRRIRHARSLIEDDADGPYPFDQSFAPDAQTAHSMNNGHEFHAARSTPQKCAHGPQTGSRSGEQHCPRISHGAGILSRQCPPFRNGSRTYRTSFGVHRCAYRRRRPIVCSVVSRAYMTVALLVAVVNSTMDLRAFPWQYFSDVALHLDWPSVIERCESHVVLGTS